MPGERTLTEAERAVRMRFRALMTPQQAWDIPPRLESVSCSVAMLAASRLEPELLRAWHRAELKLAEERIRQSSVDLKQLGFPAAFDPAQQKFPPDAPVEVRQQLQLVEAKGSWVGPVPFEAVPRGFMKRHQVVLRRGQAWLPLEGLIPHAARTRIRHLLLAEHPFPTDPRMVSLCKLWIGLLKTTQEPKATSALPLDNIPACLQRLLSGEVYPAHEERKVVTNLLCRLGHRNIPAVVMPAWRGIVTEDKQKAVAAEVAALEKTTLARASYNCSGIQMKGMCPHLKHAEGTPRGAIWKCFGCSPAFVPSPVAFVTMRKFT